MITERKAVTFFGWAAHTGHASQTQWWIHSPPIGSRT